MSEFKQRIPQVSEANICGCLTVTLGYRSVSTKFKKRGKNKTERMNFSLEILTRHAEACNTFLSHVVTSGENWIDPHTPESKQLLQ